MKLKLKVPYKIWIDADACPKPVKEILFKSSARLKIELALVANAYQAIPQSPLITLTVVGKKLDEADQYIVDHVRPGELVVTADIPLAAKVVAKKAFAVNPRGEIYTEENIGEILSMRDFMKDLRDGGAVTGGPSTFGPKDVEHFANSINKLFQ
ncbi:MAG: YaiI/YqxD family protein [Bacteriovorax sp.]|nr:YaiI/YqxD family protein [Bacteriovorax sp.]